MNQVIWYGRNSFVGDVIYYLVSNWEFKKQVVIIWNYVVDGFLHFIDDGLSFMPNVWK